MGPMMPPASMPMPGGMPVGPVPGGMGGPMPGAGRPYLNPWSGVGPGGTGMPMNSMPYAPPEVDAEDIINYHGRESYPVLPEEAHMGVEPQVTYYDEGAMDHPLDPHHERDRIIVKLPHPRYHGAPEFVDGIPKRTSTFAWTELCGTREPECAMTPVPQVQEKSWYNSYVYIPEQRSHVERQYLERYVQGPDGEWIDVVKARRMCSFFDEQKLKADEEREEQKLVKSGEVIKRTDYLDAYSGEHLIACENMVRAPEISPETRGLPKRHTGEALIDTVPGARLMTKAEVYDRYGIHKSEWGKYVDTDPIFEFDNLRVPWPYGQVDRNKKVSQHLYDWFDRRNPHVVSDKSYNMMELPSYYVDEDLYGLWRPKGGVPKDQEQELAYRSQYLEGYNPEFA